MTNKTMRQSELSGLSSFSDIGFSAFGSPLALLRVLCASVVNPLRVAVVSLFLIAPSQAWAGMPSVGLTDVARMRVQTISFFFVVLLACAWGVRKIWNDLRNDFPALPFLSYRGALGLVALWGLLFLLVLTMISGARELMTPGAWRKEGLTYQLNDPTPKPTESPLESNRRQQLERLRSALWRFAQSHDGRLPADADASEISEELWQTPDPSGMRYLYVGGQSAGVGDSPLAYEPEIFGDDPYVLLSSGELRRMSPEALREALGSEEP